MLANLFHVRRRILSSSSIMTTSANATPAKAQPASFSLSPAIGLKTLAAQGLEENGGKRESNSDIMAKWLG
jgi:hypothetical protein